ncbi:hypothetical protein F4778DRAFT_543055 [Xylariomycetidae sp. FL2044]|nr:hypothetical protein F4778DRAFT_543055 [Xylariomycetidae sp. FL2044]
MGIHHVRRVFLATVSSLVHLNGSASAYSYVCRHGESQPSIEIDIYRGGTATRRWVTAQARSLERLARFTYSMRQPAGSCKQAPCSDRGSRRIGFRRHHMNVTILI